MGTNRTVIAGGTQALCLQKPPKHPVRLSSSNQGTMRLVRQLGVTTCLKRKRPSTTGTSSCCGKQVTIVRVFNTDKESAPSMMGKSYQPERSSHETQVDAGTILRFQCEVNPEWRASAGISVVGGQNLRIEGEFRSVRLHAESPFLQASQLIPEEEKAEQDLQVELVGGQKVVVERE